MTKTFTFAAVHFSIAFSVAYVITGSALVGGAVAIIEPSINTVAFHFHEKLWKRYSESKHKSLFASIAQASSESYALRSM